MRLPEPGSPYSGSGNIHMSRIYFIFPTLLALSATPVASASVQSDSDPVNPSPSAVVDTVASPSEPSGQPFQLGGDQAMPPGMTPTDRSLKSASFFSSPTGTLLKSVAFPGWGQWANGKKQKAAVYFGVESYWITKAMIWRNRARTADNLTEFAHARDRRNYFYWLTGITVFVSMFDAYADRYLLTMERTRDAGDDFWGELDRIEPSETWQLTLSLRF